MKTAINQFKVKEFTELSKNSSLLNLPIHYYLIGYTLLAMILTIIVHLLRNAAFLDSFFLPAVEFMLISYMAGFIGLFFLYKLMDAMLAKKLESDRKD